MKVAVNTKFHRYIEDQLKSGRYASPQEVVQAGLTLLQQHESDLADVRRKIAEGLEQARRGELLDGDEIFNELFGPAPAH